MSEQQEKKNTERLDYIKIDPSSNLVLGKVRLNPELPLPVLIGPEEEKEGVTLSSIKAGLIHVLAFGRSGRDEIAREHFDYYKDIILSEDDAEKKLYSAATVRMSKKDYATAIPLVRALCAIAPREEYFILLSTIYGYEASDNKGNDDLYQMYDTLVFETLRSANKLFPESANVPMELGCFHFKEGNWENAIECFDTFLERAEKDDKRIANAESLKLKAEKAIEEEDKAAEIYDNIMMDKAEEGEKKAKALVDENPKEYRYHLLYGWALRTNNKFKEAKEVLMTALKLGGDDAELFNELALVEWEIGSKELAKEYMKMANDMDSKAAIFASNLALMCIQTDDLEEAARAMYSLIEIDRRDPMIEDLIKLYNEKSSDDFVLPKEEEGHKCGCSHNHEDGHHCHNHEEGHECHGHGEGHGDGHHCHNHEEKDHECCCSSKEKSGKTSGERKCCGRRNANKK